MKKIFAALASFAIVMTVAGCSAGADVETESVSEFEPPLMGWSSWNTFLWDINEDLIRQQADAMASTGLRDAGYTYINIDDGFTDGRGEDGRIRIDAAKFPQGMRALASFIHGLDLKAGIYADAGDNNCASKNVKPYGLNVGLYGHEAEDCRMYFDEWGYDFIKIDYCGGLHLGLDEQEQYTRIAAAIAACDKKDIRWNICRWAFPGTWVCELSDSWRTTSDIDLDWNSIKSIVEQNVYLSAYAGGGHYNDMDMLEIGRSILSEDEERTHMAVWCIMSSPLVIGCDLRYIPERSLNILKNPDLIAMNQDPLGISAQVVQRDGDLYVFAKDLKRKYGDKRAVVIANLSDEDKTAVIDVRNLGFKGKVDVYDCFTHSARPQLSRSNSFTVSIPAHGSEAFFVTGRRAERSGYQAEDGYLPEYSELSQKFSPKFESSPSAQMGRYAVLLGGSAGNNLEWRDVYSEKGGKYVATFRFATKTERKFVVSVNGETVRTFESVVTGGDLDWKNVSVEVVLNAGDNTISLGSDGFMPAIDCMTLKKK
ncbi:MAG: alpha-galactosidase [Bacteroidales bacterium]|nr:alpha-galactosidase [Bacteroidales bacterium]